MRKISGNLPNLFWTLNFWKTDWIWQCSLLIFLSSANFSSAALLIIQFPADDLGPTDANDVYTFLILNSENPPIQFRFIAANYTSPFIIPNFTPTSPHNVTVLVNDVFLTTRLFFSGPDSPINLNAKVVAPNETSVSWSAPVEGTVEKFRVQLLTRGLSGSISKGSPIDWSENVMRITPLTPGGEYVFEVVSLFGKLTSEPVRVSFIQFPAAPQNFRKILISESTLAVQWKPPKGFVDGYSISLASTASSSVTSSLNNRLLPADVLMTSFENLLPGESYEIAVSAIRGNWTSFPVVLNTSTKPLPPKEIHEILGAQYSRTIRFGWTPPTINAGTTNYRVTLNSTNFPPLITTENQATLTNLPPDSMYSVTVETFILSSDGPVFSKPIRKLLSTGKETMFTVTEIKTASELFLTTSDQKIRFLNANATSEDNLVTHGEITDNQVFFRDLVGGTNYQLSVKSLRDDVEEILFFEKMTYPLPPVNVYIDASLITPESVLLEWTKLPNTRLQGYEILYNKLDDKNTPETDNSIRILVSDLKTTKYNLTGLLFGTKYSFRLRGFNENLHSAETLPLIQCTRPLMPIGVTVKAISTKLLLELTRPSTSTKYYRLQMLNLDLMDEPPFTMNFRNNSDLVQLPIPIDYFGATYEVKLSSSFCNLSSQVVTIVVNSLPPAVDLIRQPFEVTQTSMKIFYQLTWPPSRSIFTRYVFQISGMGPRYVSANELKDQTIEFTELIPGKEYSVAVWTERENVQSDRNLLVVQLKPDNIIEMNATTITSHSIAFQWTPPNGIVTQYEVGFNNTEPIFTNMSSWVFNGLLAFQIYSVYVAAWSGTERSSNLTRFYTTLESNASVMSYTSVAYDKN